VPGLAELGVAAVVGPLLIAAGVAEREARDRAVLRSQQPPQVIVGVQRIVVVVSRAVVLVLIDGRVDPAVAVVAVLDVVDAAHARVLPDALGPAVEAVPALVVARVAVRGILVAAGLVELGVHVPGSAQVLVGSPGHDAVLDGLHAAGAVVGAAAGAVGVG